MLSEDLLSSINQKKNFFFLFFLVFDYLLYQKHLFQQTVEVGNETTQLQRKKKKIIFLK